MADQKHGRGAANTPLGWNTISGNTVSGDDNSPFTKGREARRAGKPLTNNPYNAGYNKQDFVDGWNAQDSQEKTDWQQKKPITAPITEVTTSKRVRGRKRRS